MYDHPRPDAPAQVPSGHSPTAASVIGHFADSLTPSVRPDGWTGEKQRRFLEGIADGATVEDACLYVRMSVASAYAFRRRANGQAFALGWAAANLVARDRVAATLFARAHEGQEVTITYADGSTRTRHYYDNGLALRLLNRLDRYADAGERTAPGQAARLIAADFDAYLATVEGEGGPARAGLFLSAREGADDVEPLAALARADRMLRTGAGLASEVDTADLDPAKRGTWTAAQWARAEAAGLLQLAPPPPVELVPPPPVENTAIEPQLPQRRADREPVWWCEHAEDWRTSFPPPDAYDGEEEGDYGDPDYERSLSDEEHAIVEGWDAAWREAETAEQREREVPARDRYFADYLDNLPPGSGEDANPAQELPADRAGEAAAGEPLSAPLPAGDDDVTGADRNDPALSPCWTGRAASDGAALH